MNKKPVSFELDSLDNFLYGKDIYERHAKILKTMPIYYVLNGVITRIRVKKKHEVREVSHNGYA